MARVTRWSAAAIVSLGLTIGPAAVSYADQPTKSQIQSQINRAKAAQSSTQSKVATLKQNIQQLNQKSAVLNSKLSVILQNLNDTQSKIDQTSLAIQERNREIADMQTQIAAQRQKLQLQYQVLVNRLRVMYEAGHTSYLEVLFSSTSFSDLLSRFHLLTLVAQQDKTVFDGVQAQEHQLIQKQSQLNQALRQQRTAYAVLLQTQSQQTVEQNTERRLLGQVQNQTAAETADLNNEQNALADIGSKLKTLQQQLGAYDNPQPSGPWDWPVPGYYDVTSGYGWRTLYGRPDFHPGIDIGAPIGTPIVAATSGRVLFAGPASGYGEWIVIDSGNGLMEIYGHMYPDELEVSPGEIVQRGQEIAKVGNNGDSTGPHLHFEVATGIASNGIPTSTDPTAYVGH